MAGTGTKRITELTEASTVQSGDFIAVDSNARGTKKVSTDTLATSAALTAETNARAGADEQMSERMDGIEEQTALIQNPTKTLSGALVSFTDGANMPMKSCIVSIVPKQSGTGTPSPDNVRPISGWESVNVTDVGKNLLPPIARSGTQSGISYSVNADGSITLNGTATAVTYINYDWTSYSNRPNDIRKYIGIPMFCSITPSIGGARGQFDATVYTNEGATTYRTLASDVDTGKTFTFADGDYYGRFYLAVKNGATFNNETFNVMMCLDSDTDKSFVPYTGTTTTVNLGRTVYGGTLDVVSGALTVTHVQKVYDGTTGHKFTNVIISDDTRLGVRDASLSPIGIVTPNSANPSSLLCDRYNPRGTALVGNCYVTGGGSSFAVIADKAQYGSLEDMNGSLSSSPIAIVYELATPQTYTLTPTQINTLLGDNNVWADSGDVEITYRRDISIVINNLESALNG